MRKSLQLIHCYLGIELERFKRFKLNYFFDMLSTVLFVLSNILFWDTLYHNQYIINGWSKADIWVFLAYVELFFGIKNGCFASSANFWMHIVNGKLEGMLLRPTNVILRTIIFNINLFELLKGSILYFALLNISGAKIYLKPLFLSVLICFMSAIVIFFIQLGLSFLAFKFGRVDALIETIDSLLLFNKYPLNIMPTVLFNLFKYLLPYAYFSTLPAMISLNQISINGAAQLILILISLGILWCVVTYILWLRGLKCYDGYHS